MQYGIFLLNVTSFSGIVYAKFSVAGLIYHYFYSLSFFLFLFMDELNARGIIFGS